MYQHTGNDDSLIRAGFIHCATCGRIGYPTDATCLDERLVLVTYPAMCSHVQTCTMIVDPGQMPEAEIADVGLHAPGRRCAGTAATTRKRCRSYAEAGSEFCSWHSASDRKAA